MPNLLRNLFILWGVACFWLPCVTAEEIALYHTSDIHGYFFSRPDKNGQNYGGFAALESILQAEERPFIIVDSGDFSSGNKEANASDGKLSIDLMNRAGKSPKNFKSQGYAALTIGNHDSDFGDERLGKTLSHFSGDILSMNIKGFQIPNKTVKPYGFYEVGGKKLAFIGFSLDGPGMQGMQLKKVTPQSLENLMKEVLAQNPSAIIFLAHDSIGDSRKPSSFLPTLQGVKLAKENIDVILGGHAHVLQNTHKLGEKGPLFVESGAMLEGTSRVIFDFDDKTGALNSVKAEYIRLDGKQDEETAALLDEVEDKSLRQEFATVPVLLPKYPAAGDSAPAVARLVAEEMYQWVSPQEKIDMAMFQLPGIRRDLLPGTLTGRDITELLPYTEYVSTFDITGKHLKRAVEQSIKHDKNGDYSLFSYSENVRIAYKYNAKNEQNPVKITSFTIDGKKVKNKRVYRVAAIAHIPQGYFEGAPFKATNANQKIYDPKTSGELLFDLVKKLDGATPQEKQLKAPAGVQIRKKN